MAKQKNPAPATFERTAIDTIDPADINPIRRYRRELVRGLLRFSAGFLPNGVIHDPQTLFSP
ncbi:hypothetical protein [Phyllobacterium bourgognense]|uniref:hypothetical protein n=1 Tax=Phyllobacterium bourgognense TaxID=314236 RepID=UPI0011C04776|nr:hypothetical protein [Phyllobacterium bourgognense]